MPMRLGPLIAALLLGCQPADPPGNPSDSVPTGTTTDWDPSPVAAERGSIARFRITCGLLQGTPIREFRKVDDGEDRWQMLFPAEPDVHPEIVACTTDTDNYLEWLGTGDLEVLASDLWHELSPTTVADRWIGTTWPLSGSSPECDAALESLNLGGWPVTLTMELVEIVPPDAAR